MNLVVAVDKEWGIGNKGDLLARVKDDLRNFKTITDGKIVILGSNTLSTFPGGRVLKNRTNIVLNWDLDYAPTGAVVVHSLDELFEELKKYDTDDVFVIGGASMYKQLLPYCQKAYVTKFDKSFEKDVYVPNLDQSDEWRMTWKSEPYSYGPPECDEKDGFEYYFTVYERI